MHCRRVCPAARREQGHPPTSSTNRIGSRIADPKYGWGRISVGLIFHHVRKEK